MINPYAIIGALVLWGASLAGTGWWFYGTGRDVVESRHAAIALAESKARDQALQAAAEAIAKIEIKQQTIVKKVQHEVQTNTVYRDCVVPADGVRLLNDAISGKAQGGPASGGGVQPPAAKPQ